MQNAPWSACLTAYRLTGNNRILTVDKPFNNPVHGSGGKAARGCQFL